MPQWYHTIGILSRYNGDTTLATKVMGSDKVPEVIKVDKLDPDQEQQLNELKRWIRNQQRKAAAQKRRMERAHYRLL
jgi:hypothetical protein